jgi:hypothetical protein
MNVGPNSTSASSLEGDMSNKFKKKNGRLIQDNMQGPGMVQGNSKNMI